MPGRICRFSVKPFGVLPRNLLKLQGKTDFHKFGTALALLILARRPRWAFPANTRGIGRSRAMANGIYVAASGAIAKLRQLDIVANNLANASTPGFKSDAVTFREVLGDTTLNANAQDRSFVQIDRSSAYMKTGAMRATGNALDLGIQGEGFLKVQTDKGVRLLRDGRLRMDTNGGLLTFTGDKVLGREGKPVIIPTTSTPVIDGQGQIWSSGENVGALTIVTVEDTTTLRKDRDGLYIADEAAIVPAEDYEMLQGFTEESNANAIEMMVELVEVQRNFEAMQKAISAYRDMDASVVRIAR
jgi:flagellar basal-body rod protein FlgG